MDTNDESAIVNSYLRNADLSLKPEIYLGTFTSYILSVRVNGRCLRPPRADLSIAESYSVMAINSDILLSIRYVSSDGGKKSLLFIAIGEIGPCPRTVIRYVLINWARECVLYGWFEQKPKR
jgi:hypothetical protein